MKKIWFLFIILACIGVFVLVGCTTSGQPEQTYVYKVEENGVEVTYTLSLKSGNNAVMTKVSPAASVTYEGKYETKSETEYEITLTRSSSGEKIPASLTKMKVTLTGSSFTFGYIGNETSDEQETKSTVSKDAKEESSDNGDPSEEDVPTGSDPEPSDKTDDDTPPIEQPEEQSVPCMHPAAEIVTEEEIPSTCASEGHRGKVYCKKCGFVVQEGEVVPKKTEHEIEDLVIEDDVPATCAEEGHTGKSYCRRCGTIFVAESVIAKKTDHQPEDIITEPGYPATCAEEGLVGEIHCRRCGAVLREESVIPKTDHLPEDIITEPDVPSTCTTKGHTGKQYCRLCEEVLVAEEELDYIDHILVNKRCTMCEEIFPAGSYNETIFPMSNNDGEGNSESTKTVCILTINADGTYTLKKHDEQKTELVVSASRNGDYMSVTFLKTNEMIDALEENGYQADSTYLYHKTTEENDRTITETIELNEPDNNYDYYTGLYTQEIVTTETTERQGEYTFNADTCVVSANGRSYTLNLEQETFFDANDEEKSNTFQYGNYTIVLYYGQYSGVTLESLSQQLLSMANEEIASDHYQIIWTVNDSPVSQIDVPTSPFSLTEDQTYVMALCPIDDYVMIKVVDTVKTYLYFALEDEARACVTVEDYETLLTLSDNYTYTITEQYVLSRTLKSVTVVYVGSENVEVEKQIGETYSIETYFGCETWYTETHVYVSGNEITIEGNITLYPCRYTITYYDIDEFQTITVMMKPDSLGTDMDGFENMGFLLNNDPVLLANLPDEGSCAVYCHYVSVSVENAPTENAAGNYLTRSYIGSELTETREDIPILSEQNYEVTETVAPSLVAAGEKRYYSAEYGTYDVTIDALTTQTFTYGEKEYTITLGEGSTATLTIDGVDHTVTTAIANGTLTLTETEEGNQSTDLYHVSVDGFGFIIDEITETDLPASIDPVVDKTYKGYSNSGYVLIMEGGDYYFQDKSNEETKVNCNLTPYVNYFNIVVDDEYWLSLIPDSDDLGLKKVIIADITEPEGFLPSCSNEDIDEYAGCDIYRVNEDILTFQVDGFTYIHGEDTITGKYRTENIGNKNIIVLYSESSTSNTTTYVYSIENNSPKIEINE